MVNLPVHSITEITTDTTYRTTIENKSDENSTSAHQQFLERPHSVFKILIADDNELVRHSLQQLLMSVHIKVTCVSSGEEVLKHLLTNDFDLILIDIIMPGLNGIETAKRIRTQTALDHVVIIGMTADTSVNTLETCLQAGMKEVYSKLSKPELLIATVRRFFLTMNESEN
jgi:two-component system CAI-1 autoinducer sensor kinase/phosphatase CqsS